MRATQKERDFFPPDKFANNSSFVGQICIIYGAASLTLALSRIPYTQSERRRNEQQPAAGIARAEKTV
jgi:hypothetical protein